jgi:aspartate aminotransferase
MPRLADRTALMPASPIRKLAPFADAARQQGVRIFGLNIGQPDLETPPQFLDAIQARRAELKTISYAPSEGYLSFRTKLAQYYDTYHCGVGPDDILITCGGSEALLFTFLCCFDPGDEVIVPEPFYANYLGYARQMGVTVVPIPTSIDTDFELPSPEEFAARITPRTRAILICNPSNPTGKLLNQQSLVQLQRIVLQHDLFLIADEVYKEFLYDGHEFYSALRLDDIQQNVIVVDSVSKRWSACGVRIGNLVTRNKEVRTAALKYGQARLSPPTLGQIGSEALLDLPESYYEGVRAEYVQRRNLVVDRLNAMHGVTCNRSAGAFYVMPRFPVDNTEDFCKWLLQEFRHNNTTVMMAPAAGFYSTPGSGLNEARIAYVLQTADLTLAMDALEIALAQYPGRV